jgi:hypothetical protein
MPIGLAKEERMLGFVRQRQTVAVVGFATVLVVSLLAVTVAFSSEAHSLSSPRWAQSGGRTFQTFKSPIMPVDQLLMDPRACVAVVEPVERGVVYGVTVEQRSDFGVYVEDVEYDGNWPFTPVTVRVLEPLRGELPETIVVWEERGTILGLTVDSSDPYLEPGQRGLLIFASVEDRWFPIVFAEVDVDGAIPALDTTVEELRNVLARPG